MHLKWEQSLVFFFLYPKTLSLMVQFKELNIDNIAKEEVETSYCFSNMQRLKMKSY